MDQYHIQLPKIWEQMNLAYEYGADRIWIVNVGDLKPMEVPIEFFLGFARDPKRWNKDQLSEFTRLWAEREFGPEHAAEIADLVSKYTKYNARRKPEQLTPETFSLVDYHEAERVQEEWQKITLEAETINEKLPADQRDAFFELVLYPVKAAAIVNELYITAGKNHLYAKQGRASTNQMSDRAARTFQAGCGTLRRVQPQTGGRQMEPHDGPDASRLQVLEPASGERDACGDGIADRDGRQDGGCSGRRGRCAG